RCLARRGCPASRPALCLQWTVQSCSPPSPVQSALGLALSLPAPAARVLPRQRLGGARRAPDGQISLCHQRVLQNSVLTEVAVELVVGPRRDRVDLHQPVAVVPLPATRV